MNAATTLLDRCVLNTALLFTVIVSTFHSEATTLTWDSATGDGVITEGVGTWNASSSNRKFTTDNGLNNVGYSSGSDVIFGGGGSGTIAYTVNIGGTTFQQSFNANVNTLTFNSGARYTLGDSTP